MRRRAWSTVFAGAALAASLALAVPAPAAATEGREPAERGVWSLAAPWLGDLWSRVTAAVGLGIDPNGSPVQGEAPDTEPSGDISWGIDPNG